MACISRTEDDVNKLIVHAKLTEDELLPVTQMLEFTPNFGEDSALTCLLELDKNLLGPLKEGDRLIIRGDSDDFAVLCTKDKTFEVRDGEISNSLVVVPDLLLPNQLTIEGSERVLRNCQVTGVYNRFLEVRPCRPRLKKLFTLLMEQPFKGPDHDDGDEMLPGNRYTWDDLLDQVQCSEEQLQTALTDIQAYHIYGFWQILDFDYKFKIVSELIGIIEQNSWPLDGVPRKTAITLLSESEPRTVAIRCFDYFLTQVETNEEDDEDNDGDIKYSVNDDRVSCLFGEALLKQVSRYNLKDFLNMWQQSVPEGVTTSLSQLEGVAMVDRSSSPEVIWHYPISDLPEEVHLRFSKLFETKDKWTLDEIRPYIQDLSTDKVTVGALLAKNCRASTQDGIKHYTARLSK